MRRGQCPGYGPCARYIIIQLHLFLDLFKTFILFSNRISTHGSGRATDITDAAREEAYFNC